eukprot:14641351-Ditylum_brightwellii.AAC.1
MYAMLVDNIQLAREAATDAINTRQTGLEDFVMGKCAYSIGNNYPNVTIVINELSTSIDEIGERLDYSTQTVILHKDNLGES